MESTTETRIALLKRARTGRRLRDAGILLLARAFVIGFGLGVLADHFDSSILETITLVGMLGTGCPGAIMLVSGIRRRHRSLQELDGLERLMLPPARVV